MQEITLTQEQIASLSSHYLQSGSFQDDFKLDSVIVSAHQIEGTFSMLRFGISPEDTAGYHLTAPTVFRVLGQAIVIHGHRIAGFDEKRVEVWVRDHALRHRRPVRNAQAVAFRIRALGASFTPGAAGYLGVRYAVDIEDGAVSGETLVYFDFSRFRDQGLQALRAVRDSVSESGSHNARDSFRVFHRVERVRREAHSAPTESV